MKFIVNYHSDSASTAEMLISALQTSMSTVDLYGIATKAIEKIVSFFKTKDLNLKSALKSIAFFLSKNRYPTSEEINSFN